MADDRRTDRATEICVGIGGLAHTDANTFLLRAEKMIVVIMLMGL